MPPELILATIQSSADAFKAFFTWLCTPEGQEFSKQMRANQAKADAFWAEVGNNLQKLFDGELFKRATPTPQQ